MKYLIIISLTILVWTVVGQLFNPNFFHSWEQEGMIAFTTEQPLPPVICICPK